MKNYQLWITVVAFFATGFIFGMIVQQGLIQGTLIKVASNMDGVVINIEINETLMIDRATENMEEIFWDIRMENCTRTEKNYCALQCYEDNKLIPCENFTNDEHFCSNGICETAGGCPTYFDRLEGKTVGDCIEEIMNDAKGELNETEVKK